MAAPMLRLRLSWMSWRRRVKAARMRRAVHRLEVLDLLMAQQILLVQRLERELTPELVEALPPSPESIPLPTPAPEMQLIPPPEELFSPEELEEPEEPMPDHLADLSQQLGLLRRPT